MLIFIPVKYALCYISKIGGVFFHLWIILGEGHHKDHSRLKTEKTFVTAEASLLNRVLVYQTPPVKRIPKMTHIWS